MENTIFEMYLIFIHYWQWSQFFAFPLGLYKVWIKTLLINVFSDSVSLFLQLYFAVYFKHMKNPNLNSLL